MAEAAAERQGATDAEQIRALAAATDNVGLFFGEDIFIAIGSILLMKGVLDGYGIHVEPFHLSMWAIPTALTAFLIHGLRLWLLDRVWRVAGVDRARLRLPRGGRVLRRLRVAGDR